jgi:uncharacterized protein (TIGR03437 family)
MMFRLHLLALLIPLTVAAQTYTFQTVAGGALPTNLPATSVDIVNGYVATSPSGDVYMSLTQYNIVVKLSATGSLDLVAGNGAWGYSGDGGPATSAQISAGPITVDNSGNLYVVSGSTIREISNGTIMTIGGTNEYGYSGDGGPAVQAEIGSVEAIASDSSGNVYFADVLSESAFPLPVEYPRIRKISAGIITTVAGNGTAGSAGDGGPATAVELSGAEPGLAVDSSGNLFISDSGNFRIREVSGGIITTYAGSTQAAYGGPNGDGGPVASALFLAPGALTFDSHGDLFVADGGTVREISGGVIQTVAGNVKGPSSGGDGGPATDAGLGEQLDLAVDPAGNLFIFDNPGRLREVSSGVINTVAGNGGVWTQDGVAATSARLPGPRAAAVDASGNIYVAASFYDRIWRVSGGSISTFAGNGTCQYSSPVSLTSPFVCGVYSLTFDAAGNLYVMEAVIYEISQGAVTTVPGSQQIGYFQTGIAVDMAGNLYIADTEDNVIQKLSNGALTTVAGIKRAISIDNYTQPLGGWSGDGGPATQAQLDFPNQIAIDSHGTIYFTDSENNRVRAIANGVITTVAGNGASSYSGDGGPAIDAGIAFPEGLAIDGSGNLYIGDANGFVRKVSGGIITTIAGGAMTPINPQVLTLDASGNVYIVSLEDNQIDELIPSGPSCSYTVQQPSTNAPMSGGTVSVAVVAASGCNWVVSNLPSWITESSAPSGALLTVASNAGAARSATILIAGQPVVLAQNGLPVAISTGGVVNAASYSATVAPGSIAAVFGSFPVDQPAQAAAFPIPSNLQGVSIQFNSLSGALFYAGPNQMNVQLPLNLVNSPSYAATAVTGYGTSAGAAMTVAEFAPGVFTINGQGTGQGAILNLSNQLVDTTHPANAGDYIQIYCTGLGETTNNPGIGLPAPADPLSVTRTTPTVSIGGVNAVVQFSGLAPGMVGLNQINAQIPAGVAAGAAVPVSVSIGGAVSNTVTIAVE